MNVELRRLRLAKNAEGLLIFLLFDVFVRFKHVYCTGNHSGVLQHNLLKRSKNLIAS